MRSPRLFLCVCLLYMLMYVCMHACLQYCTMMLTRKYVFNITCIHRRVICLCPGMHPVCMCVHSQCNTLALPRYVSSMHVSYTVCMHGVICLPRCAGIHVKRMQYLFAGVGMPYFSPARTIAPFIESISVTLPFNESFSIELLSCIHAYMCVCVYVFLNLQA